MSRLFHSLVVCGAGLTLVDCGGRYGDRDKDRDEDGAASGTGAGGSSRAGSGGAGAGVANGGISGAGSPSGGSTLIDTAGSGAVAGSTAAGGAAGVDFPEGAEGQWFCSDELLYCTSGLHDGKDVIGFGIAKPCQAQPERPRRAADCVPGDSFDCLVGFLDEKLVLFNCECSKPSLRCNCPAPHQACVNAGQIYQCDGSQTVCGCAMPCIAR